MWFKANKFVARKLAVIGKWYTKLSSSSGKSAFDQSAKKAKHDIGRVFRRPFQKIPFLNIFSVLLIFSTF
jgi:hypothetical protein